MPVLPPSNYTLPGALEPHKSRRLSAATLEEQHSPERALPSHIQCDIENGSSRSLRAEGGEDLSDCICDPGNSSQAETAESLIFRKIT